MRRNQKVAVVDINTDFDKQLLSDTVLLQNSESVQRYILTRASEFSMIAQYSIIATQNIAEFKNLNSDMKKLIEMGSNVQLAATRSVIALELLKHGKGDGTFQTLQNNAIVSYLVLNSTLQENCSYIKAVDNYLKDKHLNNYIPLAYSRDLWVKYNIVNSSINHDAEMLKYWEMMGYKLSAVPTDSETRLIDRTGSVALFGMNDVNLKLVNSFVSSQKDLSSIALKCCEMLNYGHFSIESNDYFHLNDTLLFQNNATLYTQDMLSNNPGLLIDVMLASQTQLRHTEGLDNNFSFILSDATLANQVLQILPIILSK